MTANIDKAWTRLPSGRLRHICGLEFELVEGDGYTDVETCDDTLAEFQKYELARGVPVHDLAERLQRLCREAAYWNQRNQCGARVVATGDDLRSWQDRMGLDFEQAALALGVSRATYFNLLSRDQIDRRTELAAASLEAKITALTPAKRPRK